MDFHLTDEQRMLEDAVARFVVREPSATPHADAKTTRDAADQYWHGLAELGLLGLPFDEAHGGSSGGHIETALVMQQFGKALVIAPYTAAIVQVAALMHRIGPDDWKRSLVPRIAEGRLRLAIAYEEAGNPLPGSHIDTTCRPGGNGFVVRGHKTAVLTTNADALLVVARHRTATSNDDRFSILLVRADTDGVTHRQYPAIDGSQVSEYIFDDAHVPSRDVIYSGSDVLCHLAYADDAARLALCAEAVGIMDAMTAQTVAYSKTRKQFGVAIGSFQALQHRMVEMFVHCEQARSALWRGVAHMDDDAARADACAAAKALIGFAARFVGQQAIQLHGGMGMSNEMQISHYFRRLTAIEQTLGNSAVHLRRLAIGISAGARC